MKRNRKPFHFTSVYYRKVKKLTNLERHNFKIFSEKQCSQNNIAPEGNVTPSISVDDSNISISLNSSESVSKNNYRSTYPSTFLQHNTNQTTESIIEFENDYDISEIDAEEEIDSKLSMMEELKNWALVHRITHRALNEVLGILKLRGSNFLPKDCRTLLQTPQRIDIVPIDSGQFWYYGLKRCLLNKFPDLDRSITISITFNIDGLPIFNSAKIEFWPILCIGDHSEFLNPMPIAVYCGQTKPNLQNYLDPFVKELQDILENGVKIGSHKITVTIKGFVCDTPARCFIRGKYI